MYEMHNNIGDSELHHEHSLVSRTVDQKQQFASWVRLFRLAPEGKQQVRNIWFRAFCCWVTARRK